MPRQSDFDGPKMVTYGGRKCLMSNTVSTT